MGSGGPKIFNGRVLEVVVAMVFTALSLTFYGYQLSSTLLRSRMVVMNTVAITLSRRLHTLLAPASSRTWRMALNDRIGGQSCSSTINAFNSS